MRTPLPPAGMGQGDAKGVYYENRGRRSALTTSEKTKVNPEKTYNIKGEWFSSLHEGLIFTSFDCKHPEKGPLWTDSIS